MAAHEPHATCTHATHDAHERAGAGRQGPGVRHDGRPAHRQASPHARWPALLFLLGRLPREVRRRSRAVSRRRRAASRARPSRQARSTPARCIPRSGRPGPAHARSAAWRSSRRWSSADAGPNPELADMTRRFWIGLALDRAGVRAGDGRAPDRTCIDGSASRHRTGYSSCWRRRSCCGPAGRSSSAAGPRSRRAISTCSR